MSGDSSSDLEIRTDTSFDFDEVNDILDEIDNFDSRMPNEESKMKASSAVLRTRSTLTDVSEKKDGKVKEKIVDEIKWLEKEEANAISKENANSLTECVGDTAASDRKTQMISDYDGLFSNINSTTKSQKQSSSSLSSRKAEMAKLFGLDSDENEEIETQDRNNAKHSLKSSENTKSKMRTSSDIKVDFPESGRTSRQIENFLENTKLSNSNARTILDSLLSDNENVKRSTSPGSLQNRFSQRSERKPIVTPDSPTTKNLRNILKSPRNVLDLLNDPTGTILPDRPNSSNNTKNITRIHFQNQQQSFEKDEKFIESLSTGLHTNFQVHETPAQGKSAKTSKDKVQNEKGIDFHIDSHVSKSKRSGVPFWLSDEVTATTSCPDGPGESSQQQNSENGNQINSTVHSSPNCTQENDLDNILNIKQKEQYLQTVQIRQQAVLKQQEDNLHQLIALQRERQRQLELLVNNQQERINKNMQILLQAPVLPVGETYATEDSRSSALNLSEKCSWEREKAILEESIESLKRSHAKDVELLQMAYEKQLSILEESIKKLELRFRAENENIEREYEEKIRRMREERRKLIEDHAEEMKAIREKNAEDIHQLRQKHKSMLQNLRYIQSSEIFTPDNPSVVDEAMIDSGNMNDTQRKIQLDDLEKLLKIKEAEIQLMRDNMAKQQAAINEERKSLMVLVNKFEIKLSTDKIVLEQERDRLKQESDFLKFSMEKFEEEKGRILGEFELEKKELQRLKASIANEKRAADEQIRLQKLELLSEKSRLQTLTQLYGEDLCDRPNVELKAEAEAAIQQAHKVVTRTEVERAKLREQQKMLAEERWRLQEKEREVAAQAMQVENLAKLTANTRQKNLEALQEIRHLEQLQMARTMEIQQHMADLTVREKKLADERIQLSQERLRARQGSVCPSCTQMGKQVRERHLLDPRSIIVKLAAEQEGESLAEHYQTSSFSEDVRNLSV